MGLLDDAIREHLELKRRRGADPGEVAREQHEALDPVPREPGALADDGAPLADDPPNEATQAEAPTGVAPPQAPDAPAEATSAQADVAADAVGGETEELDMRAVLEAQDAEAAGGGGHAAPDAGPSASQVEEDSLKWEVPGDAGEHAELEQQEADEDVLEETPEFLRDTPEQERLWFEQRPPRDFDFDK